MIENKYKCLNYIFYYGCVVFEKGIQGGQNGAAQGLQIMCKTIYKTINRQP